MFKARQNQFARRIVQQLFLTSLPPDRIGIIRSLVSSYESGALKLSADMALRFAHALEVSVEEILEPGKKKMKNAAKPSRKVLRRLELIQSLPNHQQQTVLKTIDAMLRGLKTAS